MKRLYTAALLSASLLAGYASAQPGAEWPAYVAVQDSSFDTSIKLTGRPTEEGRLWGRPAKSTHLVTLVDKKTGAPMHILMFVDRYDGRGWRFWSSATTDKAVDLTMKPIARDVGSCNRYSGCTHVEQIAAVVPHEVLQEAAQTEVRVRFRGRSGDEYIVTLDRADVQRQLAATADTAAKLQAPPVDK